MQVHVLPILKDNYGYVLEHDGEAIIIDPGEAQPLIDFIEKNNLKPRAIWNTHHHADHVDGNEAIAKKYNVPIMGPEKDKGRIPGMTDSINPGDSLGFAGEDVQVLAVPGHTLNHIAFYFPSGHLFLGDLLFGYSCGAVFEGTMQQMYESVSQLLSYPDDTKLYCGHEYTFNNRTWAAHVEPENQDIKNRIDSEQPPTVPLNLGLEKRTNPFLRTHTDAAKAYTGKEDPAEVFAQMRLLKNSFSA